jgi:predicted nucleic acid-binding protein
VVVLDASVFVDALVNAGAPGRAARAELEEADDLDVPAIFGAEATSALWALVRRGELPPFRTAAALEAIRTVRATQYPFELFSLRVWELRDNLTIYDAWYVALAEELRTELVTSDARIRATTGLRCRVRAPDTKGTG